MSQQQRTKVRDEVMKQCGVTYTNPYRDLPKELLTQLQLCADNEARRLLLGVSK